MRRDNLLQIRCTTSWKEEMKSLADKNGVTVSDMVYYTLNNLAVDEEAQAFMRKVFSSSKEFVQAELIRP